MLIYRDWTRKTRIGCLQMLSIRPLFQCVGVHHQWIVCTPRWTMPRRIPRCLVFGLRRWMGARWCIPIGLCQVRRWCTIIFGLFGNVWVFSFGRVCVVSGAGVFRERRKNWKCTICVGSIQNYHSVCADHGTCRCGGPSCFFCRWPIANTCTTLIFILLPVVLPILLFIPVPLLLLIQILNIMLILQTILILSWQLIHVLRNTNTNSLC